MNTIAIKFCIKLFSPFLSISLDSWKEIYNWQSLIVTFDLLRKKDTRTQIRICIINIQQIDYCRKAYRQKNHGKFLSNLAENLTSQQIEAIT